MIIDDMLHGAPARSHRRRHIEQETPIVPCAVAEAVWEEACVWLGEELPREWVRRLTVRADVAYTRNVAFRRQIHCSGDAGRDWLWAFTRHWLAAMIRKRRSELHRLLPASYNVGGTLPQLRP